MLQHPIEPYSTLQHSIASYRMLQHPTTPYSTPQHPTSSYRTLQHPTAPYRTLHHPTTPHSILKNTTASTSYSTPQGFPKHFSNASCHLALSDIQHSIWDLHKRVSPFGLPEFGFFQPLGCPFPHSDSLRLLETMG
uniref:Uncharacterized protein n=1 Tax=Coturnix japonica TaxID=93934 RepID=A0A8C2TTZ1_COTJA